MTHKTIKLSLLLCAVLSLNIALAQTDSISTVKTSNSVELYNSVSQLKHSFEQQQMADSTEKATLLARLKDVSDLDTTIVATLKYRIAEIQKQKEDFEKHVRIQLGFLKQRNPGSPVIGILRDTVFYVHLQGGGLSPEERAHFFSTRIKELYKDQSFNPDSLEVLVRENICDIIYKEKLLLSISEMDAFWHQSSYINLGNAVKEKIITSIHHAREVNTTKNLIIQIVKVLVVIFASLFIFWLIFYVYNKTLLFFFKNKSRLFRRLVYKEYVFLDEEQQHKAVLIVAKIVKWIVLLFLLYIALSLIFSIFPFTQGWANLLFGMILSPLKKMLLGIVHFLPNLFSILVIYFIMKYFIRLVRYLFHEIENEKLNISGFHPDWAMPTYSIIRFILYAFMFVLIFPFLPGSNSNIFKGVSVFIGVLFSLGSTSAIANLVAGLVITYMRPFKIGDRIKIGEITGDVIEKSMLVTRLRTPKNEEITIPNSTILTGNTTNYTTIAKTDGLIIYTTVTIGYDVPWRDMQKALLQAADRTSYLLKEPSPYVLQTSLDDFYVAYQINGYTKHASAQPKIYSELHQHIQDCCNEAGIEILSPHYRAGRDGNHTTIPADYLPDGYKAPGYHVNIENNEEGK